MTMCRWDAIDAVLLHGKIPIYVEDGSSNLCLYTDTRPGRGADRYFHFYRGCIRSCTSLCPEHIQLRPAHAHSSICRSLFSSLASTRTRQTGQDTRLNVFVFLLHRPNLFSRKIVQPRSCPVGATPDNSSTLVLWDALVPSIDVDYLHGTIA